MARTPRWKESDVEHGVVEIALTGWGYFDDYVRREMLDFRNFIWRGQCCSTWALESTLDRVLRKRGKLKNTTVRATSQAAERVAG